MKNVVSIGLSLLLITALCQQAASQSGNQAVKSDVTREAIIQRVVCFKFKPGTSQEAIQQHLQGLAALKDSIPAIFPTRLVQPFRGNRKRSRTTM